MNKLTKNILLLLIAVALLTAPNLTALANTGGPTPTAPVGEPGENPQPNPTGPQQCDWSEYKNSLFSTESKGSGGYTAANSIGATGMYQFMPGTAAMMDSYKNAPAGCKQMGVRNQGLAREACAGTQEAMMDEFTTKNLKWLKANCPAAVSAVESQKEITGHRVGTCAASLTCKVTWSGVLAGAHLGGAQGVCSVLTTGRDRDDKGKNSCGTSVKYYICKHGGKQVPDADCTPQEYQTEGGTQPPGDTGGDEGWYGFTPPARSGVGNLDTLSETLKAIWVGAFQHMTAQLSTLMVQQVQVVGTFFDAKHQLETQRLMQQKFAEANKDYHPSKQMCEVGTFVRNLADSERRADLTKTTMAQAMLTRALVSGDNKTSILTGDDDTRLRSYMERFCNTEDNISNNERLCGSSAPAKQINADINFTQTIDAPLTLDVNLLDGTPSFQETTLFSFLDYIFMHDTFPWVNKGKTVLNKFIGPYQDMRSLVAMRSVAQNSFAQIIAQKTQGPDTAENSVAPFLKALMKEMGMEPVDIEERIGKHPSYYAQMEILTKKIYQHPEFIANLYDKPANVKRIRAAMTAIKLMQDRDIHEALLRREMLMSMLLELKLRQQQEDLNNREVRKLLSSHPNQMGP